LGCPRGPLSATASNVSFGEHLGGAFVELLGAADVFETREQVIGAEAAFFLHLENRG